MLQPLRGCYLEGFRLPSHPSASRGAATSSGLAVKLSPGSIKSFLEFSGYVEEVLVFLNVFPRGINFQVKYLIGFLSEIRFVHAKINVHALKIDVAIPRSMFAIPRIKFFCQELVNLCCPQHGLLL